MKCLVQALVFVLVLVLVLALVLVLILVLVLVLTGRAFIPSGMCPVEASITVERDGIRDSRCHILVLLGTELALLVLAPVLALIHVLPLLVLPLHHI